MDSIVENIHNIYNGLNIVNPLEKDKQIVTEKAYKDGLDALNPNERSLLTEQEKQEITANRKQYQELEKQNSYESRLKACKDNGLTWRDASRDIHLDRLSKLDQLRLKTYWKKLKS